MIVIKEILMFLVDAQIEVAKRYRKISDFTRMSKGLAKSLCLINVFFTNSGFPKLFGPRTPICKSFFFLGPPSYVTSIFLPKQQRTLQTNRENFIMFFNNTNNIGSTRWTSKF